MRVKICGIRRPEDALIAASFGADAIGLLVGQRHRSEDFLTPEAAREIAASLPPLVTAVMVTHLDDATQVIELASLLRVSTIQMHSDCDERVLAAVRRGVPGSRLIRAVHATGPAAIEEMRDLEHLVDAFVLDSFNVVEDRVGGTGLTHDWTLSKRAVDEVRRPVILAGGLNPENVARAIRMVRPFAVDANTGLRALSGFKDRDKVRKFVVEAKQAFFASAGEGTCNGGYPGDD